MARRFDHMADVEAFVTVVSLGSLTAAAVSLGTTPSVLSRALTRLEARLGVQLVRRTTRRLSLTEPGQLYVDQARAAFAVMEDVERGLQGRGDHLTGSVRLSVPTTYAHYRLPAQLERFAALHPHVRIELNITNRNVDLAAEGFDLVVRVGTPPDSGLVSRHLEDAPTCLIASPAYLERHGSPARMDDLAHHACLAFVLPSTGRVIPWLLREDGRDVEWMPKGTVQVSDDVLGGVSLALHGLGITQTYDFVAADALARGRAVEVLPHTRGRFRSYSLLYGPHRRLSPATRALIDALVPA